MGHTTILVILITLALALSGCGADESAATSPTRIDYELFETTKELDVETLGALESIAEDRTSVTFARSTALLDRLAVKDVLLSGASKATPEGLLVQVKSIEKGATGIVVQTEPVTVFHAFRRLNVRMERLDIGAKPKELPRRPPAPPPDAVQANAQGLSVDIPPLGNPGFDEPLFDGDKLPTTEDRVNAKGKMTETVTVTFWLEFDWQNLSPDEAFNALGNLLEDLKDLFGGNPPDLGDILNLDTGLRIDGNADVLLQTIGSSSLHFEETFPLSNYVLGYIPIGPLVFIPVVTLEARFEGGVAGQLASDFGLGAHFGLGFGYADGDLDPYVSGPKLTTVAPTTTVTATAELRAELALELQLQMDGFFGPYATIIGYGHLDVDRFATPCWRMTAGLDGEVGAWIGLFGKTLKKIAGPRFPLGEPLDLGSGSCQPLPNPPPTDKLITPWSKSYSATHWSTGTDDSFTNLELSHDGRLLVSAATAKTMMKVDEKGALTWARAFREPARPNPNLRPQHAVPTLDAGILVATMEFVLVKLDQGGTLEWATEIDAGNTAKGWWKAKRRGDEVWLGGIHDTDFLVNTGDAWLVGLAPDGSVLWSWRWGTPEYVETIRDILPLDDGALIVGQAFDFNINNGRGFVLRMNADGTIRWAKNVDDCANEKLILSTAIHTKDDNFVVGGWFYATNTEALLFRLSAEGSESAPAWATRTGTPSTILGPEVHALHQLPTGELRVVGQFAETGDDRVFVAGADSIGRFAWFRRYGGPDSRSTPAASLITEQGGLLVAAGNAALEPYPGGFWLFEVPTPNGNIDFSSASGAVTTTLATESTDACLTIVDASKTTVPVPVVHKLVEVHADEVTPTVAQQ